MDREQRQMLLIALAFILAIAAFVIYEPHANSPLDNVSPIRRAYIKRIRAQAKREQGICVCECPNHKRQQ